MCPLNYGNSLVRFPNFGFEMVHASNHLVARFLSIFCSNLTFISLLHTRLPVLVTSAPIYARSLTRKTCLFTTASFSNLFFCFLFVEAIFSRECTTKMTKISPIRWRRKRRSLPTSGRFAFPPICKSSLTCFTMLLSSHLTNLSFIVRF